MGIVILGIYFIMQAAFYIVNKSDLNTEILEQLWCICELRTETADAFVFEPKAGFIGSFGMILAETRISYRLEFKNDAGQMSLTKTYYNQCPLTAAGKISNRKIFKLPVVGV